MEQFLSFLAIKVLRSCLAYNVVNYVSISGLPYFIPGKLFIRKFIFNFFLLLLKLFITKTREVIHHLVLSTYMIYNSQIEFLKQQYPFDKPQLGIFLSHQISYHRMISVYLIFVRSTSNSTLEILCHECEPYNAR